MMILYKHEVYSDVFLIIFKNNIDAENDAVLIWQHGVDLINKTNGVLLKNAKYRKPENKTDTISFDMDSDLIRSTEKWCLKYGITAEKLVYAFIEFFVQKENAEKVSEIITKYKETSTL